MKLNSFLPSNQKWNVFSSKCFVIYAVRNRYFLPRVLSYVRNRYFIKYLSYVRNRYFIKYLSYVRNRYFLKYLSYVRNRYFIKYLVIYTLWTTFEEVFSCTFYLENWHDYLLFITLDWIYNIFRRRKYKQKVLSWETIISTRECTRIKGPYYSFSHWKWLLS